jgi:hypothetical protein
MISDNDFPGSDSPEGEGGQQQQQAAPQPAFMYLTDLSKKDADQEHPVYLFQLDDALTLDAQIRAAIDALLSTAPPLPVIKTRSHGVEWRVRSYAVFVLDIAHGELQAVDFEYRGPDPGRGRNHSFDRGAALAPYRGYSALYYVNKRKRHVGGDLGDRDREPFKWTVQHSAKALPPGKILSHEGTGTNTGP